LKFKKKKLKNGYWRYLSEEHENERMEEHENGRKMGIGDMTRKNVYRQYD